MHCSECKQNGNRMAENVSISSISMKSNDSMSNCPAFQHQDGPELCKDTARLYCIRDIEHWGKNHGFVGFSSKQHFRYHFKPRIVSFVRYLDLSSRQELWVWVTMQKKNLKSLKLGLLVATSACYGRQGLWRILHWTSHLARCTI